MKAKIWKKGMIVLGIALLSAVVAFVPACDPGEDVDACKNLPGAWEVSFSLLEGDDCGFLNGKTVTADIHIFQGLMQFVISDPVEYDGFSAVGVVTCSQEEFSYVGDADDFPNTGCTTSLAVPDGIFDSGTEFTGTVTVTEGGSCPSREGVFAVTATEL